MLPESLSEVFGRGFNVRPIRASPDGHHPFQWIIAGCLVFFVMDETEDLGFMGSPIGPVDFEKSFGIPVS